MNGATSLVGCIHGVPIDAQCAACLKNVVVVVKAFLEACARVPLHDTHAMTYEEILECSICSAKASKLAEGNGR